MGITDVQSTIVDSNYPWTLVVQTDAGPVGTGEAYWGGALTEIIDRLKPFLLGENPLDIDRLYKHVIQKMPGEGSIAGKDMAAISGVKLALHDVSGKILDAGVPASRREVHEVRVYYDCHTEADPEACPDEAERIVEELCYDALKLDLDVPSGHQKDRASRHLRTPEIDHKVSVVRQVTERVGDAADSAFDCHWSFTAGSARRLA